MRFHRDPTTRTRWLQRDRAVAAQAAAQVPRADLPAWASAVSAAALPALEAENPVRALVEQVAAHRGNADHLRPRDLFEALRAHTLPPPYDDLRDGVAQLAEFACKVIHNATGGQPPFDSDSDAKLVVQAANVASMAPALENDLWLAVCRRPRGPRHATATNA